MRRFSGIVVLCISFTVPAMADIVPYGTASLTYLGTGPAIWLNARDTLQSLTINWLVGVEKLRITSYADNAANPTDLADGGSSLLSGTVAGFCIDFQDFVNPGNTYGVDVDRLRDTPDGPLGPMGELRAGQIAWLLDHNAWGLEMNADAAAAMQLAIWEIVNEKTATTYNVISGKPNSGNFYSTSSKPARAAAQGLLDDMLANYPDGGYSSVGYAGLYSLAKQDFLVSVPVLVPVPGAILMGLLGLGYAGWRLRKMV